MNGSFTSGGVAKYITRYIKILPDNECLNRTELKSFEGVVDTETIFASILADFIKVVLNKFLFLNKFDIRERLCCKFDGLCDF
jgi:hypothetical protein